jgi:hypothetical protein
MSMRMNNLLLLFSLGKQFQMRTHLLNEPSVALTYRNFLTYYPNRGGRIIVQPERQFGQTSGSEYL